MPAIRQSGVIPYRVNDRNVEVLLVTSSRGKRWMIPKGWIALGLSPSTSAAKEAWEEAGVTGRVASQAIGSYKTRKWGYPCQVDVFLMAVEQEENEYPEAKRRKRQWFGIPKAVRQIREPELKSLLEQVDQLPLDRLTSSDSVTAEKNW